MKLTNTIVTSPRNATLCKSRYPSKPVEFSPYCPNDDLYYFNRRGKLRRIDLTNGSIWANITDWDLGFECPTGYQRRIRKGFL